MVATVSAHHVTQFSDRVHLAAQQKSSRLRPFVEVQKVVGEDMAYDGLGTVEVSQVTTRNTAVSFTDIEHNRRKITPITYSVTIPLDEKDVLQMLENPTTKYVDAVVNALFRSMDDVIYTAMNATVLTGQAMGTSVTAADDGVITVDATAGFTYEKIVEILQNFIDNEVGNELDTPIVLGIGGEEHTDLKTEIELNSNDYSKNFEVKNGRLSMIEGMNVILFGANSSLPIIDVTDTTASCFAAAKGAICMGLAQDMQIKVQDRPDLIQTTQVQINGRYGAVRTEGKLVQMISTTRAA